MCDLVHYLTSIEALCYHIAASILQCPDTKSVFAFILLITNHEGPDGIRTLGVTVSGNVPY